MADTERGRAAYLLSMLNEESITQISGALRNSLGRQRPALQAIAPPEARDKDARLDSNAATLTHEWYRMLRIANQLELLPLLEQTEPMNKTDVEIVELLESMVLACEPLFDLVGVKICMRTELRSHKVGIHPRHMRRALWQLLDNALKFTPAGGTVTVGLSTEHQQLLINVSDTGCGIPAERLERMFLPEEKERGEAPASFHGAGVGLLSARHIALLHGGQLLLTSREGEGTCVTIALPDKRAEHPFAEPMVDYTGGFQASLIELANALPDKAYLQRHLDE